MFYSNYKKKCLKTHIILYMVESLLQLFYLKTLVTEFYSTHHSKLKDLKSEQLMFIILNVV